MNLADFVALVYRMRERQRSASLTKNPAVLKECKAVERQVDDAVRVFQEGPDLFDPQS